MTDQKKARKAWARWEQTYRLLRRQVTSSSREFRSSMWAGYHEKLQNVFATLVKASDERDTKRAAEKTEFLRTDKRIHRGIDTCQDMLDSGRKGPHFAQQLREAVEKVDNQIERLRAKQREKFDVLLREERLLDRDIQQFDSRLQTWDLQLNDNPKKNSAPGSSTRQRQMASKKANKRTRTMLVQKPSSAKSRTEQRLADIDTEIDKLGGRDGGWDSRDHTLFVRLLRKHQLDNSRARKKVTSALGKFLDEVTSAVPHLVQMDLVQPGSGHDECKAHYEWYRQYRLLTEEKKELIQRWREEKDAPAKEEETRRVAKAAEDSKQEDQLKKERQRRAKAKQRRQRAQVQAWREEQARKEEEEEIARRKKMEDRQAKMKLAEAKRRERDEMQLALYKLQQEQDNHRRQRSKELLSPEHRRVALGSPRSSPGVSADQLARVQARQQQGLHKAKKKGRRKRRVILEREKAEQKARAGTGRTARDLDRLMKPTRSYLEGKVTKKELMVQRKERSGVGAHDSRVASVGMQLRRMAGGGLGVAPPVRARPVWRKVK